MKVIAAYLLAVLGGNESPTADDIKRILGSVGATADDDRIQFLINEMNGRDVTEVVASGREKLGAIPCGRVAVAQPATALASPPPVEEKVEDKEESEEEDLDIFNIFGD